MTATSLEGDVSSFKLHNQEIDARSHQRVFRFRYRGPDIRQRNIGEPEYNDFDARHRSLLAVAARASASFPMVFKPVSISREQFKHLSPELEKDSLHIDGGVLDNKPIRLALEAVYQRRADKQVDRRLFYVEPIPENINDVREPLEEGSAGGVNHLWTPLRVLYAAVKDLPSYQSIASALEELRIRNDELDEVRQTLSHYEALAAKVQMDAPAFATPSGDREISSAIGPTRIYIPGGDNATRLFRAQEDSYLDLRLSRSPSALFHACKSMSDELIQYQTAQDPGVLAILYRLKNQLLWAFDFDYHRRHYQYLHQVTRQLFTQLDQGELVEIEQDRRALFQSLNRLRARFNDQEAQVVHRQDRFREAGKLLEEQVKEMLPRFSPELLESGGEEVMRLIVEADNRISQLPGVEEQCEFFYRLRGELRLELEREHDRLDFEAMVARNNPRFRSPLENGYNQLKAAVDRFHERDMIIYPMMRKSGMTASELQTVRAARFGPLDGVNYIKLSDQSHKVAGETAFHFGGFMNETWRGNDIIWGRLDAVETIFRQLLPDGEKNPLFQELFDEQKRIVVEMREKFEVGIVYPLSEQEKDGSPPHEDLLIGKQNIHDIPDRTKIIWLKQSIGTAVRMIFFPEIPIPAWCQRCFSGLFVRVLVSPRRVLLLVALVCAAFILGLSALAAHFLAAWLPRPGSLPAQAGEVAGLLWIFLLVLFCFALARFAHSIRSKFLRDTRSPKKIR